MLGECSSDLPGDSRWTDVTCSLLSPLARHLHAAAHLLCLPSLLAQRLRGDATVWRQDVLPGVAWTWAIWELEAGSSGEGSEEGSGSLHRLTSQA